MNVLMGFLFYDDRNNQSSSTCKICMVIMYLIKYK